MKKLGREKEKGKRKRRGGCNKEADKMPVTLTKEQRPSASTVGFADKTNAVHPHHGKDRGKDLDSDKDNSSRIARAVSTDSLPTVASLGDDATVPQRLYYWYKRLAFLRHRNYYKWSMLAIFSMLVVTVIRYRTGLLGEAEVATAALENTASALGKVLSLRIEKDLAYQDMVANLWSLDTSLNNEFFRRFVMSPVFEPVLESMSAIGLVEVVKRDERAAFEARADTRDLLDKCCNSTARDTQGEAGSCAAGAARFCSQNRFFIAQVVDGVLGPAPEQDEYVVVSHIEPFETNVGAWGFNLASNSVRKEAWEQAVATGQQTFTRRINLVQSSSSDEYAFLVWKAVFEDVDNPGMLVFKDSPSAGRAVGSVNGVYQTQRLLDSALAVFADGVRSNLDLFLYDSLAVPGEQFLALSSFDSAVNAADFSASQPSDFGGDDGVITTEIRIRGADAEMILVVRPSEQYFAKKASGKPMLLLIWSLAILCMSQFERHLGRLSSVRRHAHKLRKASVRPSNSAGS